MRHALLLVLCSACATQPPPTTRVEPPAPHDKISWDIRNSLAKNSDFTIEAALDLHSHRNFQRDKEWYVFSTEGDQLLTQAIDERVKRVLDEAERNSSDSPPLAAAIANRLYRFGLDPAARVRADALRAAGATWHETRAAALGNTHPLAARFHRFLSARYGGPALAADPSARDGVLGPTLTVNLTAVAGCPYADDLRRHVAHAGGSVAIEARIDLTSCVSQTVRSETKVPRTTKVQVVDHVETKTGHSSCFKKHAICWVTPARVNPDVDVLTCSDEVIPLEYEYCGRGFKGDVVTISTPVMKEVEVAAGVPQVTVNVTQGITGTWSVRGKSAPIAFSMTGANTKVEGELGFGSAPSFVDQMEKPIIDGIHRAAGVVDYVAQVPGWKRTALAGGTQWNDAEELWLRITLVEASADNPLWVRNAVSRADVLSMFDAQPSQGPPPSDVHPIPKRQ